ncbi:uncharacterized protein LOC110018393 [Phalaenopsis equestris]|uniref:uncharacterized protein LOC110018393 n=1 Tax=Phalaenopsis equestris TaxID=78828 RepID=UPI0009E1A956|nr:uncharacterized protein LOC110018393 [Phalaenopsis equestris]
MCPLRFILMFLSATLAGFFAWKSIHSPSPCAVLEVPDGEAHSEGRSKEHGGFQFRRIIGDGIWVFWDMASGRYLWRMLKRSEGDE